MRFISISSIAWLLLCASVFAQNKFAGVGGIVYGKRAAFNIGAPDRWVVDPKSGQDQGFPCVLYPKDSSWSDAETVMYADVEEDFTDAGAFAASAIEDQKRRHHCIPKERVASGKTRDGEAYFINEYPATATYSQWERVAYIQLPGAVGYVVLSSRNEESYRKDNPILEEVMKTIFHLRKG
jgi:hypothetical protein